MKIRNIRTFVILACATLLLGLIALGGACDNHNQGTSLDKVKQALVGGTFDLQLPAVGALTRDYIIFCSATLIAPRVVLTAGHCIDSALAYNVGKNKLRFRIDTAKDQAPGGYQTNYFDIEPRLLLRHPQWQSNRVQAGFDVGLAILKEPVPASIASPIPYNDTALLPSQWAGKEMLFLGYGLISAVPYAISPNRKHSVRLLITEVRSDRVVIRSPNKSVCHGDSGGPALGKINGSWRVLAVNSYALTGFAQGSNPPRTRCDGGAVSVRADAYQTFLQTWVERFKLESPSCLTDTDCGPCGACNSSTNACRPKLTSQALKHCSPCTKDADCGQGLCVDRPEGKRCMSACDASRCCPEGSVCLSLPQASGDTNICIPWSNPCPAVSCNQDSDCSDVEACIKQQCKRQQSKPEAKLCFPCQSHRDCGASSLRCLSYAGERRCLSLCQSNDACPPGYLCKAGGPGQPKRCEPTQNVCSLSCRQNKDCPTQWTCKNQQCLPPGESGENESCNLRSCQAGLTCVTTLNGKRCLRPCAVPVGEVGGPCKGERTCTKGSFCLVIRGRKHKYCAAECKENQDCKLGGACHVGYCVCRNDSECLQDAICEKGFNSDTGFCVKKDAKRACPTGQSCAYFASGSYCVTPGAKGRRWIGQACSSIHPCHEGLDCVAFGSGAGVCAENCSQSLCRLGGRCTQGYCLCTQNLDCPKGRVCDRFVEVRGVWTGMCLPSSGAIPCHDTKECLPNQKCEQGTCITLAPPKTEGETSSEDWSEPISPKESGVQTEPVAETQKDASTPTETASQERKPVESTEESPSPPTPPPNACGCHTTPGEPTAWLALLLFLSLWIRRFHSLRLWHTSPTTRNKRKP